MPCGFRPVKVALWYLWSGNRFVPCAILFKKCFVLKGYFINALLKARGECRALIMREEEDFLSVGFRRYGIGSVWYCLAERGGKEAVI